MEARVSEGCGPDAETMIQATPLDQLHMGLARWRKKFGELTRYAAAARRSAADTGSACRPPSMIRSFQV